MKTNIKTPENTLENEFNPELENNSYGLFNLIWQDIISKIKRMLIKDHAVRFPKSIGDYSFVSKLEKIGRRKSYQLAIYRKSEGIRAIFKMRSARFKDYNYYSLKNEIILYKVLNSVIERLGDCMPQRFKNLCIPKIAHVINDNKRLGVLLEYLEGTTAQSFTVQKKIEIYLKMVDFLRFLGNNLSEYQVKLISKRSPIDFIFLYPLLVISAIFNYPKSAIHILLGVPVFLASIPYMIKDAKLSLVHRDLHFNNIVVSNEKLVLIDLQECVFSDPLYEVTTALKHSWKRDEFHTLLLREINRVGNSRRNFKSLFKGLIVNSVTHGLTGKGSSEKTIYNSIDFLKYGINLKP